MLTSANLFPRSRSAQVMLHQGSVYVFSNMLVNRLGETPFRLEAKFEEGTATDVVLGQAVRRAVFESLPWVEWEEFESRYDPAGDPVSAALGIPNKAIGKATRQAGRVSVADWPDRAHYVFTAWVQKGARGEPLPRDDAPLPKGCTDELLGARLLKCLQTSLVATLAANRK